MNSVLALDAHIHIYRTAEIGIKSLASTNRVARWSGTTAEATGVMDKAGISAAIALVITPTRQMEEKAFSELSPSLTTNELAREKDRVRQMVLGRLDRNNEWGCEVGRETSRLIPFINLDPHLTPGGGWQTYIEDKLSRGARGLKLLPVFHRFRGNSPELLAIFEVADAYGLPVLSMSGKPALLDQDPNEPDYGRPIYYAETLNRFPRVKLILAHFGRGYEKDIVEMCTRFPNLFTDLSLRLRTPDGLGDWGPEEAISWIRRVGVSHVLFGSNWPNSDPSLVLAAIEQLKLSEAEKCAIRIENVSHIIARGSDSH